MMQIQRLFLDYLENIDSELSKISISENMANIFCSNNLKASIKNTELIIPVVGAFSSGKSTLINSFLGKNYLPVGISPETSLASELRFSTDERLEAVLPDDTYETHSLEDIKKISERAKYYKYLRVFINNERLKSIEPLVLVDMPGFDAPNKFHNKAILEYLGRGVSYIVLIKAIDGTLSRSLLRKLIDMNELGKAFSIFLSQTNLKADSELEEIKNCVQRQIEDEIDCDFNIELVDNNMGDSLNSVLKQINPEELFRNMLEVVPIFSTVFRLK